MTAAQAAKLEAEASAAQNKLGKGPPPQPVPDVKKLAKKEEKKDKPKPPGKGQKGKKPGKTGGKAGAAASAVLKAVGSSKVAQYLAAKAGPVLAKGMGVLQKLRQNEQTHDNAAEKQAQAEQAVVIPASEGQAKGNTGQVNQVSARPAPPVDESKGKQKLQQSLKENVPKTIEDVDNFQRDKKGQHMGADVMTVVLSDKNAVVSTYQDMGQTPPPAPREHEPDALPAQEQAPPTGNLNLGKDGIAPLQKEHTDVSSFTNEADAKLKEEGVTQEQLDMVDSGDLAIAKKEKKGMETAAKAEPLAVQKFAQDQGNTVAKELKEEGNKNQQAMKAKRKGDLGVTGNKQKKAKSDLEKKREEVAAKINGIYTAAQDKVKKRLADLETESMKRFDDGNAKATKEFEDGVNREIEAFKSDRYSGWFGWARKAKDWLCGIDELPEVKGIFDRNRAKFVATIDRLVADIAADNKRVVQECKDELQNARTQIKDYVDKLGPALRDVGQKAAEEMNSKLDELDKFVAKKEEDLQNKLKDKQTAAIKAIDEKIEKMKESMAGALSKLGKLLLAAAKKFFTWALEKFGVSLSTIEGIINKGAAVLKAIFTQPVKFVKNLMNAAITGFKNFGKNFLKHLQDALFEWLTGSLEGLKLPSTWDLKGIIGVALQMIGISYENIRRHMVTVMTEPVVAGLEKTFTLVKTLVTEGPMAAWEQLKEMAGEMRDAFIDAVKDFIKQKVIEEAIKWIVALFVPGAGLIKAAIGIYDTIVFFIQKAKQIIEMISNFLGSIGEIAAGNIGAAADAMEKGLARGLSLVISFLAQLLHLNAITDKIKAAIQKIRAKVDAVLLKVAKWIADKAKALMAKAVGAVKAGVKSAMVWWEKRRSFKAADGKEHTLSFKGRDAGARLMLASEVPATVTERLTAAKKKNDEKTAEDKTKIPSSKFVDAINKATAIESWLHTQMAGQQQSTVFDTQIDSKLAELQALIQPLPVDDVAIPLTNATYMLNSGRGYIVKAQPLTKNAGNTKGSSPQEDPPGWEVIDRVFNKAKSATEVSETTGKPRRLIAWRRVHLLSAALNGPGLRWNLTPTNQTANTRLEKIETTVRGELTDPGKPKIYPFYGVQVDYGHPDREYKTQGVTWNTKDYPTKITLHMQKPEEAAPKEYPIADNLPAPDAENSPPPQNLQRLRQEQIDLYLAKTPIASRLSWSDYSPRLNINRGNVPDDAERARLNGALREYYNTRRNA
jgi:hypothetical protein